MDLEVFFGFLAVLFGRLGGISESQEFNVRKMCQTILSGKQSGMMGVEVEGSGRELSELEDTWTSGISRHQSTEEEKIAVCRLFRFHS